MTRWWVDRPERAERVADDDTVGGFDVYHTPGRTPGHVAYVHADRDAAFVGDLVREDGGDLEPSPWLLSYDTDAVAESIDSLAERAPAFAVACVGHGDPLTECGADALPT